MKSSLRHQINHGHTWCRRYLMYWFLLSLLLSRVTLLFSLHSMGSSTITKWIRFIYAISFAKHANPFPLLQMMLVGPSRSEHYIAFQIRFCWKIQLPFSWSIPTNTFVQITIYLIFTMEVFTVSLLSQCLYKIIGCNNFMVKLLEAIK